MNKVFLSASILIVLFLGFKISHAADSFTINMTDDAFEPSTLKIEQGDTVVFKNVGKNDHWPASNIHPTHEIYPEFDPKKPIPPGEKWEFKFTKSGSWKLHDHLYPNLTGTITVTETAITSKTANTQEKSFFNKIWDFILSLFSRPAKNEPSSFTGKSMNEIARDTVLLKEYIKEKNLKDAMDRLIQESDGGSSFDCHQPAHSVGRIGYEVSGEKAFQDCTASCHSGCYHGAMESFLNKNGTTNIAANIKRICETFETSFGMFECLHGVGHGILAYTDYSLPEAIKECQNLGDPFSISSCYGGLFMENILTGQGLGASTKADHQTSWLKKTDPYYPCNAIGNDHDLLYQCYQMQTSWMLTIDSYDFNKVAGQCLKAPKDMIPVCVRSYGRDVAGFTLRNAEKIISLCNIIADKNNYRDQCLIGAVNVIVDFWGQDLKDQASALCRLANETNKNSCYSSLMGRLEGLFKEKEPKLNICNTMESPYKEHCLSGYEKQAN